MDSDTSQTSDHDHLLKTDVLNSLLPIPSDVADGLAPVLPFRFRYMDLMRLVNSSNYHLPGLVYIPDEWDRLTKLIDSGPTDQEGSAILTGQRGIGKTLYLYYRLIQRIINAEPTMLQCPDGQVVLIKDQIYRVRPNTPPALSEDVLALVDADVSSCTPDSGLLGSGRAKIVVASPLARERIADGSVHVSKNLRIFMGGADINLYRLQLSVAGCGMVPRTCLQGALSEANLRAEMEFINRAIRGGSVPRLVEVMRQVESDTVTGHIPDRWLHIHPTESRIPHVVLRPVSQWAFNAIDTQLAEVNPNLVCKLYDEVQFRREAANWRRNIWECRVHAFFQSLPSQRAFPATSLDDPSRTVEITFPPGEFCQSFGPIQSFTGQLKSFIQTQSIYLRSRSPAVVCPSFGAFLYHHDFAVQGVQPLLGLQITDTALHPVSIEGLKMIVKALTGDPILEDLRPSIDNKLAIVFVVPEHILVSFSKRPLAGSLSAWDRKISQYVLGLNDDVWKAGPWRDTEGFCGQEATL
ncbi:hypothetical protein BDN72DRAFT_901473 [Pluteus cervinus]|uniref:Uncharacterized protein n=1 Tax=Pluteus cervinus TaxID=181527 RepID=A0ACD3AFU6_9AGAR|nr:hypothetical protein BDN72DRAFT_901473 [Pluteus cervinus]